MIRIALAVVAGVGLTFTADAQQIGPLCQTLDGNLAVCSRHAGAQQIGPLWATSARVIGCRPPYAA
jgi:hypothetical protein